MLTVMMRKLCTYVLILALLNNSRSVTDFLRPGVTMRTPRQSIHTRLYDDINNTQRATWWRF